MFFDAVFIRKYLSEIPAKAYESFLSEVVFCFMRKSLSVSVYLELGVIRVYGTAEFEENLSRNTEF